MKDMIKKIVDMDKKAQELDEQNQLNKENLQKEVDTEVKNIYDKHMEEAKKTAAANEEEIRSSAQIKWEKDEAKRAELIAKMRKTAEKNTDLWVEEIVKKVLA